jgi:hypothetical protein
LSKALSYQNLEARRDEATGRGLTVQLAVLVVVPEEKLQVVPVWSSISGNTTRSVKGDSVDAALREETRGGSKQEALVTAALLPQLS